MSQADAEKRVTEVIETAKQEIDDARKAAARLSFWLTASLLMGAFSATLAAVALLDGAPFAPGAILAALREPAFPLGLGQQCCLFSEPVAGVIVEGVDSLEQAVATVMPGTIYLPADASTGTLGDIYATIPGGRDWRSRQHGGSIVYRVRASV